MKFRQVFLEGGHTSEEFDAALDLLPLVRAHGLASQDDRTEEALQLAGRLLRSSRSLVEIEALLNESDGEIEATGA